MRINTIQGQNFGATIKNNKVLKDVIKNYCLHMFQQKPINKKFVINEFSKVKA